MIITRVNEISKHVGEKVQLNGWVYQRQPDTVGRRSGIHDKRGVPQLPAMRLSAGR